MSYLISLPHRLAELCLNIISNFSREEVRYVPLCKPKDQCQSALSLSCPPTMYDSWEIMALLGAYTIGMFMVSFMINFGICLVTFRNYYMPDALEHITFVPPQHRYEKFKYLCEKHNVSWKWDHGGISPEDEEWIEKPRVVGVVGVVGPICKWLGFAQEPFGKHGY
ncbi:hypothetical protein BKA65DRAFT_478427 [Rhexocercosporidium sp. MPI-PUGE-AT-0058]|nr:hypothetical protein BKA65DRAFT_478427 [Rhexocercosporidium sp. MPI-PUGE-AT-0058]